MNDFLQKLSTYNIFNFLLPGVLYVVIVSKTTDILIVPTDLVTGVFLYYFIGLVISRLGSLLLGPVLKFLRWTKHANYEEYIEASKSDSKIIQLLEDCNMYRTLAMTMICCLVTSMYADHATKFDSLSLDLSEAGLFALLVLFLISFKKQTQFITKRVEHHETTQTNKN